ncbi:MAG: hypothetical protein WC522_08500 [Candidatus Omnitrophota bacterium]
MNGIKNSIVLGVMIAAALAAANLFSAEPVKPDAADKTPARKPQTRAELTKEELLGRIKKNLDRAGEIINFVQGLKKETDAAGNVIYTYNGKRLEDLDAEALAKLFSRVGTEAVRIRTEKLNKQLENIRRAEQISRQAAAVNVPPAPPALPPAVTIPSQPPAVPAQPPKAPPVPPKK